MLKRHATLPVRDDRLGFTLLELLIVVAIIMLIAAMVVPNLIGNLQTANEDTTRATINRLAGTVGAYAADHDGTYFEGTGSAAWQAMINPGTYKGRKLRPLMEEPPLDAWGRELQYEWTGDGHSKKQNALKPAIWSLGANGKDEGGSGDDINNWTSMKADDSK